MFIEILKDKNIPSHTLKKGDKVNIRSVEALKLIKEKVAKQIKTKGK